jgi:hypothetical protein
MNQFFAHFGPVRRPGRETFSMAFGQMCVDPFSEHYCSTIPRGWRHTNINAVLLYCSEMLITNQSGFIVHGAWRGARCWSLLYSYLSSERRGRTVQPFHESAGRRAQEAHGIGVHRSSPMACAIVVLRVDRRLN